MFQLEQRSYLLVDVGKRRGERCGILSRPFRHVGASTALPAYCFGDFANQLAGLHFRRKVFAHSRNNRDIRIVNGRDDDDGASPLVA